MSYFSPMSTLYTLNYYSSRLFGIIIDAIEPRLHIYIHNVLPSDISWTCDSREIPLETYFSPMSTLYTLNYYSSRLFGIIIDAIEPRLHIYIHNVLPSDISWTCDSREIPLETYNMQQPSFIMSYFSLMSTLYTLNYHSSRL